MADFGKRGGTSPTPGKRATTYTGTLPDGSTVLKRTFYVHDQEAVGMAYQHDGDWFLGAIRAVSDAAAFSPAYTRITVRAVDSGKAA